MPTGTNVIGDPTDMTSQSLAKKLCKLFVIIIIITMP